MRTVIHVCLLVCALTACAEETYVAGLRSPLPSVRVQAAVALGRSGDREAVPALARALGDKEAGVRREAAKALGLLKDARAAGALLGALEDRDPNVRFYAAYALGEIQEPKAAPALIEALADPVWGVRDQAAWALRELRDPALAAPLVAALEHEKADVAHVVWVLRFIGGKDAPGLLAKLLADPRTHVRAHAVGALAAIGGEAVAGPLIAALKDRDPAIRRAAVQALLALGDERAVEPLKALAASETEPALREMVQKAALQLARHQGLAAHWSFDDKSTTVARDVSGAGIDGQIKGCKPVKGKVGHALAFATGQFIELGKPSEFRIGARPFTVAAWAKSEAPNGVVVARGGAFCGFSLYIKDGLPKFGIHRTQEGPAHIAAGRQKVVGRWVHLAGVVKQKQIELYVDGALAATAKTPDYIPGECGQGMEIGFDEGNSPAEITDNFQGVIDEVKVFHAALSKNEIAKEAKPQQKK